MFPQRRKAAKKTAKQIADVNDWNSRVWYIVVALVVFLIADNLNLVTNALDFRSMMPGPAVTGIRNIVQIALCFLAIVIAHRVGVRKAADELGLSKPAGRAFLFAFIASLPMLVTFALTSSINPKLTFLSVGVFCILAPFAEEILFRAFLFRQLYRYGRLGFWISALVPSIIFAIGHLYQSNDFNELLGISLITGLGSILLCWIFIRWNDNLWPIFALHALMNLWWEIFAVDDSALGGWLANGARLATVVLAIVLTKFRDRIWKPA
jgi:membrane protease YdiL (CAAX protease family)